MRRLPCLAPPLVLDRSTHRGERTHTHTTQSNNPEWKADLKDLYITAAKEVQVRRAFALYTLCVRVRVRMHAAPASAAAAAAACLLCCAVLAGSGGGARRSIVRRQAGVPALTWRPGGMLRVRLSH